MTSHCERLRADLDDAGFNLFAVLEPRVLGDCWAARGGSVLLIGNSGQSLWRLMPEHWLARDNPIDEYSADRVAELTTRHYPDATQTCLFPFPEAPYQAPVLQQLGRLSGWHHDSPLGTGINGRYGLWFAYRAVIHLTQTIPPVRMLEQPSPCLSCVAAPCVSACPAAALQIAAAPDIQRCGNFRLAPQSMCERTCKARLACPVAVEFRYRDEQVAYHYGRSLSGLKRMLEAL